MKKFLFCFVAVCILLACATLSVGAAEDVEYIYLHAEMGDDNMNNGKSATMPFKTVTRAFNAAVDARADRVVIVVMAEHSIANGFTEPKHDVPVTITTRDNIADYAMENGAKLVFGNAKRYVLRGDTTFEHIRMEFTNSVNYVAQYNHLTFGEGCTHVPLTEGGAGVYVVGGWQSPPDSADVTLDSHITVKSGSIHRLIGGTRQMGDGQKGNTYTGTHYIDIEGGYVDAVIGASYVNQISDSVVIRVTGGKIRALYTGGDVTRRLEKDATVYLTGGEIDEVHVNNVLGTASVTLQGAKVGMMDVTFANADFEKKAEQAKKPDTLYYDARYYTSEQIAAFGAGFDTVENITYIYAKANARGDGLTAETPASFADAMQTAAEAGGVVILQGALTLTDFEEPVHADTIRIQAADSNSKLTLYGRYTLHGETEFALTLQGDAELHAEKGCFVASEKANIGSAFNIVGSAKLYRGGYGAITKASQVLLDGATVQSVTGDGALQFEMLSGKVGTLKTAETVITSADIAISGGSVDTVVFHGVKEELSFLWYGGTVGMFTVSGENAKGMLKLDESKFSTDDLGTAASLFALDTHRVYFVSADGTGNGTSESAAGGSLAEAYKAIGDKDGTVVICSPYDIPVFSHTGSGFLAPAHSGKITITSVYEGVDYREKNGAYLGIPRNFYLGGETVIDGIHLVCKANYNGIFAAYHDLTIGAGVECSANAGITLPCLLGGTWETVENVSCNIVLNGGDWQRIRLGNSSGTPKNASVTMTINGGRIRDHLMLASAGNHDGGTLKVVVNGGTLDMGIVAVGYEKDGNVATADFVVELNGGTVCRWIRPRQNDVGTVNGTFTVHVQGGNFSHLVDISGDVREGDDLVTTLNVSEDVDLNAALTGTYTYQNYLRAGPDPFLFYNGQDGWYYYMSTNGNTVRLLKTTNFADLDNCLAATIYDPKDGEEFSSSLWAPEIHYLSEKDVGAENAGWYLYVGGSPAGMSTTTMQRLYVLKCLDGNDLMGRWGHPVTGEVNVPQKLEFPGTTVNTEDCTADASFIEIGGKKYFLCFTTNGRETSNTEDAKFYQSLVIADIEKPWIFTGATDICVPEYDWEKGGANKTYPQVVEGPFAIYAPDGTIYVAYSGSGYWTTLYSLGALRYKGGEPKDIASWEKLPTPYLSKSDTINGCGHASFFTDTAGKSYVVYHAYVGQTASGSRYTFIEPFAADKNGITVGNGSGKPAPVETVWTASVNPLPLGKRIGSFTETKSVASNKTVIKLTIGKMEGIVNAVSKPLDAAPVIRNSRTMLPVRFVAESFGAEVGWDGVTSTVTVTTATTKLEIRIGSATAKINGAEVKLDSPAFIENSRTYLPVRFVAENLGAIVEWDGATSTATLTK